MKNLWDVFFKVIKVIVPIAVFFILYKVDHLNKAIVEQKNAVIEYKNAIAEYYKTTFAEYQNKQLDDCRYQANDYRQRYLETKANLDRMVKRIQQKLDLSKDEELDKIMQDSIPLNMPNDK